MLQALNAMLEPAVMERLVLLLNHVLRAEPAAIARMQPYAGRRLGVVLRDWPSLLPPPPTLAFTVTPAGMLEWQGMEATAEPDLRIVVDARNPALLALQMAAGERPRLDVQGDAALAADVNWLAENLRWDLAGDLERLFGPVVGAGVARLGRMLASALRTAVRSAAPAASAAPPRPPAEPAGR